MKKVALSLMLVALMGAVASAEMLGINSYEQGGYILNDLSVHTDGAPWLSSLLYIELESGAVYQDPAYVATEALKWMRLGTNELDSWLNFNVSLFADANELAGQPGMSGNAANAAVSITFISDLVGGQVPAWDDLAARIAMTPDASGMWAFQVGVKDAEKATIIYSGPIVAGAMIPEPGTVALLLCGLIGLCVLRRK